MPYDGTALSATDLQVANYTRLMYPNPFFDLSRHYFPKSVKSLLEKWTDILDTRRNPHEVHSGMGNL